MSIWNKIFHKGNQDKDTIIALSVNDSLKIFKSIDAAILYLKKNGNEKLIHELVKLRNKISGVKKVKAVRITKDNEIIEYDDLDELKKHSE